jgi:hypothetical protein
VQGTQLPSEWSALNNVTQIDITYVKGLTGGIPSSWKSVFSKLVSFAVFSTTSLNATLADYWAITTRPGAPPQQGLWLMDMGLQGTLPAAMLDPAR